MLRRSTLREIRNSLGRYLAIIGIVALGVGFFSGLKITREAMLTTADDYLKKHHLYDYNLYSTIGFDGKSVKRIKKNSNVIKCAGAFEKDVFLTDYRNEDITAKVMTGTEGVNTIKVEKGRAAKKDNECVVDAHVFTEEDIGKYLTVSSANAKKDRKVFRYSRFRITGLASSPLYMNYERGSTDIGKGTLDAFVIIRKKAVKAKYYTNVYVTSNRRLDNFSDEYDAFIDKKESSLKTAADSAREDRHRRIVNTAKRKLKKNEKKYRDARNTFLREKRKTENDLESARKSIEKGKKTLGRQAGTLKKQKKYLTGQKKEAEAGIRMIEKNEAQLEASRAYLPPETYAASLKTLQQKKKKAESGLARINAGLRKLASGKQHLKKGKKKLAESKKKYIKGKKQAEAEFAKAERKLDDSAKKLKDARREIDKIDEGKSYVLTRSANIGYSTFENNAQIVTSISKIFPLFFFLVAALVCMTTMTRMIDEQRTQIGVLKALGYSNASVLSKYMFYSGSAAAIGSVAGYFLGIWIFPAVIWHAYTMMYDFSDTVAFLVDWPLFFVTLAASLICAMGSTWLSCEAEFRIAPANLIRPKAPKAGRRILLEKLGPVWERISFMWKISLRNVFRYKGRFIMMCLGISGCTALLIAGFGINTSVKNLAVFQYDEVMTYDYKINFSKNMTSERKEKYLKEYGYKKDRLAFIHESSADVKYAGKTHEVNMIASDANSLNGFINLHSGDTEVAYPGKGEVLICDRFRVHYGIDVGDEITLSKGYRSISLKVSGVVDNYVNDFVYINPETAEKFLSDSYQKKTALVKLKNDATVKEIRKHSTKAARADNVMNVSVNQDMLDRIGDMMESLNAVVVLVIISAALLAFIVLYNLTNINITERIREIATIKVLGFYPSETSSYVFRENFLMTGFSLLIGVPLGKWLLSFVINEIRVDLTYFVPRITFLDYLWSVLLTFVFTLLVNLIMYRRLEKISMTESLKSVE